MSAPIRDSKGFTLIELMVVIVIIAVLATIGAVMYSSTQKAARISKRIQDLDGIKVALETYKATVGKYPSVTTAGIPVCLNTLTGTNSLVPNYMPVIPADPSGGALCYKYTSDGTGGLGGPASANNYKVVTDPAQTEMVTAEFAQQQNYIDPDKDGTADDNCVVTPAGPITGWAIYTQTNASCNW